MSVSKGGFKGFRKEKMKMNYEIYILFIVMEKNRLSLFVCLFSVVPPRRISGIVRPDNKFSHNIDEDCLYPYQPHTQYNTNSPPPYLSLSLRVRKGSKGFESFRKGRKGRKGFERVSKGLKGLKGGLKICQCPIIVIVLKIWWKIGVKLILRD